MRTPRPSVVPPLPWRALVVTTLVAVALATVAIAVRADGSAPGSPPRHVVDALLATTPVVADRPSVTGYERGCSGGEACVFGPAWSDTTGAPGSGNGCSTRQDVLVRDLGGTSGGGCTPSAGSLVDPYTGRTVDVDSSGLRGIHVDHVFPLSAAWDLGASEWSAGRRARFANDVDHNLLAVAGGVNSAKSDSTPAEWLPPDPSRHCFYAARYLTAANAYGLPVTAADKRALEGAIRRCPR